MDLRIEKVRDKFNAERKAYAIGKEPCITSKSPKKSQKRARDKLLSKRS